MDTVFIEALCVDTIIGVHDWERGVHQQVLLDLEMACDNRAAAATDAVTDALDYAAVASRLQAFIEASEFRLLETMAEAVCALVMNEFGAPWLRLRLSKPGAVPAARAGGVVIERGTRP
jgi:dihydroneopterin aldolase